MKSKKIQKVENLADYTQVILKAYFSMLGKKSAQKLTSEQRKIRSQKAIKARWDKKKDATRNKKTSREAIIDDSGNNQQA